MTWITDESGTKWVEVPPRKRRKSPRALKFKDIKVGDQLMKRPGKNWYRGIAVYYIVTDRWFDPVAGQDDPLKGDMIGFAQIRGGTAACLQRHPRQFADWPVSNSITLTKTILRWLKRARKQWLKMARLSALERAARYDPVRKFPDYEEEPDHAF